MKKEHELVITQYMGVVPIMINSSSVSAQNRVRLYWTNIYNKPYGLFGDMACAIPQPKDKGILLKDILQDDVPEKYYLSEKMISYFVKNNQEQKEKGNGFKFQLSNVNSKGKSITTKEGSRMDDNFIVTHSLHPRSPNRPSIVNKTSSGGSGHLSKTDQKSYCLDTSNTQAVEILNTNQQKKFNPNQNTDKAGCLTEAQGRAGSSDEYMDAVSKLAKITGNIRRLTPVECERLQTVPDNQTAGVSDTQRYKMLGNGWTVDVIVHILQYLFK